jgi:hypothetical protein
MLDLAETRFQCGGQQSVLCSDLTDARGLTRALFDDDMQAVILSGSSLLTRALQRIAPNDNGAHGSPAQYAKWISKVTKVAGAVGAYAVTYSNDQGSDPELVKEAHDARKQAVESLIEAMTDRSNRPGEWVFSFGLNPGLVAAGFQYAAGEDKKNFMPPQLSVPLGLGLDKLPNTSDDGPLAVGQHFQFTLMDPAQLIAYDKSAQVTERRWDTFLTIGLQYGLIIGTPSQPFMIGADARWAPSLFPQEDAGKVKSGALRMGLFASYYVPVFDLN